MGIPLGNSHFNEKVEKHLKKGNEMIFKNILKGKNKEFKTALIIFMISSFNALFYFLLIKSYYLLSINITISLLISFFIYMISKLFGTVSPWVLCSKIKNNLLYKSILVSIPILWLIFTFFEGDINNPIFENIIKTAKKLNENSSIRWIFENNIYLLVLFSTFSSNIIWKSFSPTFINTDFKTFKSKTIHELKMKREIKKVIDYHKKNKDYLFNKDKDNLKEDLEILKKHLEDKYLHEPAQIYDILYRRSYSLNTLSGSICFPLMATVYIIPASGILITSYFFIEKL